MSLYNYFTGQQSWSDHVSNKDLATRFEESLTKTGDRLAVRMSRGDHDTALTRGLGAVQAAFAAGVGELSCELQDVSAGIAQLNADFHIMMGDLVWKLERQTDILKSILYELQHPMGAAAKELRERAEYAYQNGWFSKALPDFLESERLNYQDFSVHRSIGNLYLYHLVDLPKAVEYFSNAAMYARPRSTQQAAEAEFLAGLACGLQHDPKAGLAHMKTAVALNSQFYEAHYMCASFAGLLKEPLSSLEDLQNAIEGDPRYFERCEDDPCFDGVRSDVNDLTRRLFQAKRNGARVALERLADFLGFVTEVANVAQVGTFAAGQHPDIYLEFMGKPLKELEAQFSHATFAESHNLIISANELQTRWVQFMFGLLDNSIALHRSKISELESKGRELLAKADSHLHQVENFTAAEKVLRLALTGHTVATDRRHTEEIGVFT